jgi:cytoskeletal protein RodZ
MRNTKWAMILTALLAVLILGVAATASPDAFTGTWKMNPAKSKYSPGPTPKSLTVTIESDENSYKVTAEGSDGEGKPTHVEYSAKFDGKDYPATGIPNADTVSVKRIDASTVETTQKKGGQVVMTVTTKVSKDGKTRTSTFTGKNAEGKDVHNVVVFDKQ